jgi:hypothetical protein
MCSRLLLQPACPLRFQCPRAWFRKHISHRIPQHTSSLPITKLKMDTRIECYREGGPLGALYWAKFTRGQFSRLTALVASSWRIVAFAKITMDQAVLRSTMHQHTQERRKVAMFLRMLGYHMFRGSIDLIGPGNLQCDSC